VAVAPQIDLSLTSLSLAFDGLRAVSDMSCEVTSGSIVALIGPNGAGKTTIFNLICGFLKPDGGTIAVAGKKATGKQPYAIASLGVGRTFQDCKVFEQLTVLDNVRLGMRDRKNETILSALLKGSRLREAEELKTTRALQLLNYAGLAEKRDALACDLSYGQRKLLELCRVRAFAPKLFLLDEPFSGLFPDTVERMAQVIKGLSNNGKTVVFIEHDMEAVRGIAGRVIVLDFGRLIADGAPEAVLNDPVVLDAYLGRPVRNAS
jgi:branched-chain amino acid transport system ATP-binding protein